MKRGLAFMMVAVSGYCAAWGCTAAANSRAALRAERSGDDHLAYDLYCVAARASPSNGSANRGIRRTAGPAAEYWADKALHALDRDDYGTAFKCLMRVLLIRPDHPSAAQMIRGLIANHPDEIADARGAWLRDGPEALTLTGKLSPEPAPPEGDGGRLALGEPGPAPDPPTEPADAGRTAVEPAEQQPAPRHAARHREPVTYLATATVSRKDRRHPKMVETVDGLFVKVKDTDSDPDADLDIYRDGKRIRRVRNLCVGQKVTVAGRSGRRYDIVLRDITHRTETVRFSVRRAR